MAVFWYYYLVSFLLILNLLFSNGNKVPIIFLLWNFDTFVAVIASLRDRPARKFLFSTHAFNINNCCYQYNHRYGTVSYVKCFTWKTCVINSYVTKQGTLVIIHLVRTPNFAKTNISYPRLRSKPVSIGRLEMLSREILSTYWMGDFLRQLSTFSSRTLLKYVFVFFWVTLLL